jgi:Adenylate cyclase associated (CAP) C terminal
MEKDEIIEKEYIREKLSTTAFMIRNSMSHMPEDILVLTSKDVSGHIIIESSPDAEFLCVYKLKKKKTLLFKAEQKKKRSIILIGCNNCDIVVTVPLLKIIFMGCSEIYFRLASISTHCCEIVQSTNMIIEIKGDLLYIAMNMCKNIKLFQRITSLMYAIVSSNDVVTNIFPKKEKKSYKLDSTMFNERMLSYLDKNKFIQTNEPIFLNIPDQSYF